MSLAMAIPELQATTPHRPDVRGQDVRAPIL